MSVGCIDILRGRSQSPARAGTDRYMSQNGRRNTTQTLEKKPQNLTELTRNTRVIFNFFVSPHMVPAKATPLLLASAFLRLLIGQWVFMFRGYIPSSCFYVTFFPKARNAFFQIPTHVWTRSDCELNRTSSVCTQSLLRVLTVGTFKLWYSMLSLRTCRRCCARCASWCSRWRTGAASTALPNCDFCWGRLSHRLPSSSWGTRATLFAPVRSLVKVSSFWPRVVCLLFFFSL